jgi:polyisoprenoid-binding protein YceI
MAQTQGAAATTAITYQFDPAHSSANFKVRHMMISNVRGEFGKLTGTVTHNTDNPAASSATAEIDVASINTREPQRDTHLKSPDFFDVEKYPTITFRSKKIEPAGPSSHKVTGDLTIRGVTREVVLNVEGPTLEHKDPWGNIRSGLEATTKISRKDFGLIWNQALETGGVLVGDEVEISIDAELIRA